MRIGKIEVKRRVWIGLLFALAVTGGWWEWTRAKPPAVTIATPPKRPLLRRIMDQGTGDKVMQERAQLFDPTPLFFPTEWNFGQSPLRNSIRRQPAQVFASFEPKLTFAEQNIKPYGTETFTAPEKMSDVLMQGNEAPFAGMGQIDVERPTLSERAGFLEVRGLIDGKTIISQALSGLILSRMDFDPMEFLVVVSSTGIIGEPVIVHWSSTDSAASGGGEEVEGFFRSYLVKTFRLGERLQPGRYRVLVGP